jgi:hypothetical protein
MEVRGATMTAEKTDFTVGDYMAGAFQALLPGDLPGRDRLCALAMTAFGGQESVAADTPVDSFAPRKR